MSAPDVATLPSHPECECLKAEELARFLGVTRKTVYEYAARGVIPCGRLGRRVVFSRAQVVAWRYRVVITKPCGTKVRLSGTAPRNENTKELPRGPSE